MAKRSRKKPNRLLNAFLLVVLVVIVAPLFVYMIIGPHAFASLWRAIAPHVPRGVFIAFGAAVAIYFLVMVIGGIQIIRDRRKGYGIGSDRHGRGRSGSGAIGTGTPASMGHSGGGGPSFGGGGASGSW